MTRFCAALTVASVLALGGAARGGSDRGKGDDGGRRRPCDQVTLTTLEPGNAACPFGGVEISVPACSGDDRDKNEEEAKGKPHRAHGDGKRGQEAGVEPKVAFVCNGVPGSTGPAGLPGPPGTGGQTPAFAASNPGTVALATGVPQVIAVVDLPAGQYVLEAKVQLSHPGEGGTTRIVCALSTAAQVTIDSQATSVQGFVTAALLGPFSTSTGEQVELVCSTADFVGGSVDNAQLVAVQVFPLVSSGPLAAPNRKP
jgi:hypothetical protein